MPEDRVQLTGTSHRVTTLLAPLDLTEPVTATVYVRRDPHAPQPPAVAGQARLAPTATRRTTPRAACGPPRQ